jgi:hypothetical protein
MICGWIMPAIRSRGRQSYERFRRPDYGHLEIEVTVDDPKAYTKPWAVQLNQSIVLNTDLLEYFCENERDIPHLVGR